MTNWIKIIDENSLPPEETPILCYLDYKEDDQVIKKQAVLTFKPNSCWAIGDNWMYYKMCISHWMPLPESPNPQ